MVRAAEWFERAPPEGTHPQFGPDRFTEDDRGPRRVPSLPPTHELSMPDTMPLLEGFQAVTYEQWRELVDADLRGAPFEKKLVTHTYEGLNIQPVYTPRDFQNDADPSGFPGFSPRTRAADAMGLATCGWDVRQEHADPDLHKSNELILEDLGRGATSLQLRYAAAARDGLDPNDPATESLVGRDGLSVHSVADLEKLLASVRLEAISLGVEAGAAALPFAASHIALWKRQGLDISKVYASLNYDPLAVLARSGKLPYSIDTAMSHVGELASYCTKHMPRVRAVRVGSGPYHHAGATATQDLAFSMATAYAYLKAMTDAGLSVEQAAKQITFAYSVGCNFFLATAKLRAARKLWQKVLEACGAPEAASSMQLHVRASKRVLTVRDPWVNLLRNTVATFAAAIGGAQVITSEPFDKAIGLPDSFSRRIARNTQIILMEESHLSKVIDPAGGCYFIETMTDDLAEKAWAELQEVEKQGGMANALTSGYVEQHIASAFKGRLSNIAKRKDPITGVSEFPNLREEPVEKREPDYHAVLADVRSRNQPAADTPMQITGEAGTGEIIEQLVAAADSGVPAYAMAKALWKDSKSTMMTPIHPHPYAAPFEELRDASDTYLAMNGQRPRVFLANMGPIAHHTARATYAQNFFEAGGFEVMTNKGFDSADKAAAAFGDSGAHIAVLCSSDKLYPEFVPDTAKALREAGADSIVLAGHPGEMEQTYLNAGVDRFIFMKCDVLTTLRELLTEQGVLA